MDDLISRQAAIDALRYAQHRFTVADEAGGMGTVKWSEDVIYFAAAERVLSELPSAQPERKKGKWIPQDHNKTNGIASTLVYYYPKCSVCGHCDNYTNFCSNCGADMRDNITYADEQCLEFADVPTLANAT